ncbi:MAG: sulfite exporter TauE/SafE family protein [Deltaproteobacteria bacterium]|nr:sulfite exporter TauE/SafE family protein [Deltaproteobacteria bacterium]
MLEINIQVSTKSDISQFRCFIFFIIILCCCIRFSCEAWAHPLGGVIQNTHVFRPDNCFYIDYQTHIGPTSLLLLQPDHDRNGKFSENEKTAFLKKLSGILSPNIVVTIDGRPAKLDFQADGLTLVDSRSYVNGINTRLLYRIDLGESSAGRHVFCISDRNFLTGELDSLNYFLSVLGDYEHVRLLDKGRMMEVSFISGKKINDEPEKKMRGSLLNQPDIPKRSQANLITRFIRQKNMSVWMMIVSLFAAFFFGATHALSPGHGKTMVSAYLIGTKGRIHDAVLLGGVVTLTHVISVILLGIITVFLSNYILPQKLFPWIGVFSGMLIFLTGYWIIAKIAMGKSHNHHHHNHRNSVDAINFKSIFSLGIAGGIVPCPSALVVLLISIALQRIGFGLLLILFFSFGLSLVLILIGILTVTASKFTAKFAEGQKWIQHLPIFSAGVVMIVGISIIVNTLISAKIIVINL